MDEAQRAYLYALRALTRRDHGEAELRRKMAGKGISPVAIDDVIDRMKKAGYIDDRKYALRWAESAIRNGKGYGYRLRYELSRKGIPDDIASGVMDNISAEYDEQDLIKDIVARKFAGFAAQNADDRQKRKIVGYLQRRGFSLTAIWQALRDLDD